jgi:hypothetical protein
MRSFWERCDRRHYFGKAYGRQPDSSTVTAPLTAGVALMLDVAITRRVVLHAPGRC